MQLEDWLDDLCVRFIINLPPEELVSVERICFQVEEAQWFYEDFIRPLDPSLPSLPLKAFSLRIFQHCPLFSTWSAQDYASAFAEFLAYKQRVPVRGAILLNEEMDEVVLVKGWKKGANWSFPRGKINKDENDLDCAVREVYEETGYDIQASGLVKPEKDMKYIEVTMREQHMRLYVFRGVPRNTYFEPKTRKEISKIEWYKLTDLPTLKKKNAHHDSREDNFALNANKFYMVAPFLHPLKKWIAQQKKQESRYSSSHLAAPPAVMDESATEGEPGPATYTTLQHMIASPQVPSSLPEVAAIQSQRQPHDPSAHLKELLQIGVPPSSSVPASQSIHIHNADAAKSNALLSLLRNGSTSDEMRATSVTPSDLARFHTQSAVVSGRPGAGPIEAVSDQQNLSSFPSRPSQMPEQQQSLLRLFGNQNVHSHLAPKSIPVSAAGSAQVSHGVPQQPAAPYQRTGDPQFARESPEEAKASVIPPANALPTLTHHTRALLDAFKSAPSPLPQATQPSRVAEQDTQPQAVSDRQTLLDMLKSSTMTSQPKTHAESTTPASVPQRLPVQLKAQTEATENTQTRSSNASSLLGLFKPPPPAAPTIVQSAGPTMQDQAAAPVELAAGPMASPGPLQSTDPSDLLSKFFRKDAPKREPQARRAGETAATVDGPLNQPNFESISRSPPELSVDNMRRSSVPAHRTLFDPKQPKATKILQRPDESKRATAKSPRPSKSNMAVSSPKQRSRPKPEKVFQPQILRRPQSSENQEVVTSSPTSFTPIEKSAPRSLTPAAVTEQIPEGPRRASHQSESQKQNLLSLLTGQSGPSPALNASRQVSGSGTISPLSHNPVISPLEDPISTRSRMSSLVSVNSTSGYTNEGRPKVEKRQTAAGDKAFLLGYLGRIASQEEHAQ